MLLQKVMHLDDQLLRGLSVLINRMVWPREARGGAESCAHTENTIGAAEHDGVPDADESRGYSTLKQHDLMGAVSGALARSREAKCLFS